MKNDRYPRTHLHPVAGAASLLPRLIEAATVRDQARASVVLRIELAPGFLEVNPVRAGQRFVIDGVKADADAPKGYRTDCQPGEESVLVLAEDGLSAIVEKA